MMLLLLLPSQSVTVPLQGFLNAIVYGRTREDFVGIMNSTGHFVVKSEEEGAEIRVTHYDSESEPEENSRLYSQSLTPSSSFNNSTQSS